MSFLFNGTTDRLDVGNMIDPNASAMTMSIWVFIVNMPATDSNDIVVQQLDGTGTGRTLLFPQDTAGAVSVRSFIGGTTVAGSTNFVSRTNEWIHCGMTTATGGSGTARVWLDGADDGSATVDPEASNGDMRLAANKSGVASFDGRMAEFAVWNRELSAAEMAGLGAGFSPLFYPANLLSYTPFIRQSVERIQALTITLTGTSVATHAPIIYPAPSQIITAPAAAAFVPYPNPRYALTAGMQPMSAGV